MVMLVLNPVLQAAKEKHMRAECFMVYNVLYDGVVECSNTLEDGDDAELIPQAIVYQPCRERIYGILLPTNPGIVYYMVITILHGYYNIAFLFVVSFTTRHQLNEAGCYLSCIFSQTVVDGPQP